MAKAGSVTISVGLNTKDFEKEYGEVWNKLSKKEQEDIKYAEDLGPLMAEALNKYRELAKQDVKWDEDVKEMERLKNFLQIAVKEAKRLTGEDIHIKGITDIPQNTQKAQKSMQDLGKSVNRVIKKIGKWALALFGIQSIYGAIRNAMNVISGNDKQLKADIDYMKNVIAYTLEPVVRQIVEWAKTLMQYIAYIVHQWTGKDIFGDADKKLKKANKEAKKLEKTLASFDEINIIGQKGANDDVEASFSLGDVKQIDVPDWVKWIADHKDLIIGLGSAVGLFFGTAKVASILGNIGKIFGLAGPASAVGGSGLMGLFTSLLAIAAIAGGITVIVTIAQEIWDDLSHMGDEFDRISKASQGANKEWKKSLDPIKDLDQLTNTMRTNIQGGTNSLEKANAWGNRILGQSKGYLDTSKRVVENSQESLNKLIEMYHYEGRTREEKEKILNALKQQYNYNNDVITQLNKEGEDTTNLVNINKGYLGLIDEINNELETSETKMKKLPTAMESVGNNIERALKNLNNLNNQKINDKKFTIEGKVKMDNKDISKAVDGILLVQSAITGAFVPNAITNVMSQIASWKKKFGLAHGGIINNPAHGVPLGTNIVGGERGAEVVIPLTDDTLQRLANKIPISIDLTNKLDSRIIGKQIVNINEQKKFARNGV